MKRFESGRKVFEGRLDRSYDRNSKGYFNHEATVYGRFSATCFCDLDLEFTSPSAIFKSIDLQAYNYKSTLGKSTFKDQESFVKVDRINHSFYSPFVSFDKRSTESRLRKIDYVSWLSDQYSTMKRSIAPKVERPRIVYSRPVDLGLDSVKTYENTSRSFSRIMNAVERLKDRSDSSRLRLQKSRLVDLVKHYTNYFDKLRNDRLEKRRSDLFGKNHQETFEAKVAEYNERKKKGLTKKVEKVALTKGIDTHTHYRQSIVKGYCKFEGYQPIRSMQVINLSQFSNLPIRQFDQETNQFVDFKEIVASLHTVLIKTLVSTYYLPVKGYYEVDLYCDLDSKKVITEKYEYSELRLQRIDIFTIGEFSIMRTYARELGQMYYNKSIEVAPYCDLKSRKVITGRPVIIAPVCLITQRPLKDKVEKSIAEKKAISEKMIEAKKAKKEKSIKVKATKRSKVTPKVKVTKRSKATPKVESIDYITNNTITLEKSLSDSIHKSKRSLVDSIAPVTP